ncbi:MAG: four helix bundle protein [Bacteroidales bacterium]|jgi:four helix bundle protein|nr:four helix bundle protein [Bacteroidales bacterium]
MGLKEQIQDRTKKLAIGIIRQCSKLPKTDENQIISRQLIRASCSVGANYRAVCRAKSPADFINKLNIVEEEADESIFWLEMLEELENKHSQSISCFRSEMTEILSIVVAAKKTSKQKLCSP